MKASPYDSELIALLRTKLGLSDKAVIKQEGTLRDNYPFQFDLIIEDNNKTYLVELKNIVHFEALSLLGFFKLLQNANNVCTRDTETIIAGKRITPEAAKAAEMAGIRFIRLPANTDLAEVHYRPRTMPMKITSPMSWQIISHFLKAKESSIRQIAIGSGVSYGWTHANVRALLSKGIVSGNGGYIKIGDVNKLLNGIAWERPFERLFDQEIRIDTKSPIALAQEISLVCDELKMQCGFTSFTAGEIYTGYSARHDSAYVYLERKDIAILKGSFDVRTEGGIALRIYTPDRDVFKDRRTVSSVWLVSPAQALLDCAGLGYAGRDLTLKLVEIYDQL
jgi:hypothetical protein